MDYAERFEPRPRAQAACAEMYVLNRDVYHALLSAFERAARIQATSFAGYPSDDLSP